MDSRNNGHPECPKCSRRIVSESLEFHVWEIKFLDGDGPYDYDVVCQIEPDWPEVASRLLCQNCDREYFPTTGKLESKFRANFRAWLIWLLRRF